jgi:hypothetical protein
LGHEFKKYCDLSIVLPEAIGTYFHMDQGFTAP